MSKKSSPSVLEGVLQKYCRAVVHMRQQKAAKRFGLVLGSGASKDFGFPMWQELIERIAKDPRVQGTDLLASANGHTSKSQLLYQHFRTQKAMARKPNLQFNRFESEVAAEWREIVHACLYRDVPEGTEELLKRDRYLKAFLPVFRETRLTINYNFDDLIQRLILASRSADDRKKTRGYTTVWSPDIQMYPRDGVIYHPNGFLPRELKEKPSEHLVFLEDTFADQLIQSNHGHYAALIYHLAQSTRLLLGLSLDDATLRHLLRQSARLYPGHFHYYIAFTADGAKPDEAYEKAATDSNFYTYNLITLFLGAEEVAALGELLSMEDEEFQDIAEQIGCETKYVYLITGSVSVGKSTTVSHFRSLNTMDEWLEQRAPGMDKDPKLLSPEEVKEIDEWVAAQWGLKNWNLVNEKMGIWVVDRSPLDAFAFTPTDAWKEKAALLMEGIAPRKAKGRTICPAHIVLLIGDPDILAVRSVARHREMTSDTLSKQQELLKKVYVDRGAGVTVIDTRDKSVAQVVKEVAEVVFRHEPYVVAPLQEWLETMNKHGYDA